jgi:Porin subfamily
MQNTLMAIFVALLPASIAVAEPLRLPKEKTTQPGTLVPPRRTVNSCAAFGAGFAKVDGTDTCVKIGGSVSIGVGGSVGTH